MFEDRAYGSFLGLAIGDAYGRSLEFLNGPIVRRRRVAIPSDFFMWTDDTHMALYLTDALEALGKEKLSAFTEDDVGGAVGRAFATWLDDPMTPQSAPGKTCLRGAAAFAASHDWKTSGDPESDGCGAVMRIAPLPIVLSGTSLVRAARVQALVTHAHPNAPAAAAVGCLIQRALLQGHPLTGETLAKVMAMAKKGGVLTDTVEAAVNAAIAQAGRDTLEWLDEEAIPEGDGGWRSPSALGLALTAALRWGDDPAVAIEKAARINGDSDSVACLTGMMLGATHGRKGLPEAWVRHLPYRETIERAVRRLLALV